MCGICGISARSFNSAVIEGMIDAQRHRGPDSDGRVIDQAQGFGVGHNRLSILDLTPDAAQPMWDHLQRNLIVFNGELYNYLELRSELSDYPFRSSGDTEVILAAYERWGRRCVEKFNGIFSFALWDSRRRELFCARDHIGVKPFYYAEGPSSVVFASEIKALLRAGVPARVNEKMVADYLCSGLYDHTDQTFFSGIRSLEPGTWLALKEGRITERGSYWNLAEIVVEAEQNQCTVSEADERLLTLLQDSVRLQLRSDVPLGVQLTGGLDSSSLVTLMAQALDSKTPISAFTGAYDDPVYDEIPFALAAINQLHAIHHRTARTNHQEFWELADKVQYAQEQPFGGLPTIAYWNMERMIGASGIRVVLEGQGGDELFGGYAYYLRDYFADIRNFRLPFPPRAAFDKIYGKDQVDRLAANSEGGVISHQDGTDHLATECISAAIRDHQSFKSFPAPAKSRLSNSRFRDIRYSKVPRVLRFNDRISMAFGVELRVPFFDKRLVEFSFSLPLEVFFEDGKSKSLLRRVMRGSLPDSIRTADKRTVVTPQTKWFREELRAEVVRRLETSEAVARGYLDPSQTKHRLAKFFSDTAPQNSFFVWQWLNLDLWFRTFKPS